MHDSQIPPHDPRIFPVSSVNAPVLMLSAAAQHPTGRAARPNYAEQSGKSHSMRAVQTV